MATFLRELKGEKKKNALLYINLIIEQKKKQVVLAKELIKTYNIQLEILRKIKNNDWSIENLWRLYK